MPSFFDYLQKRVYDAILLGAQEAFEHLESNLEHDRSKAKASPSATGGGVEKRNTKKVGNEPEALLDRTTRNELLDFAPDEKTPPPRKRGRARGKRRRA